MSPRAPKRITTGLGEFEGLGMAEAPRISPRLSPIADTLAPCDPSLRKSRAIRAARSPVARASGCGPGGLRAAAGADFDPDEIGQDGTVGLQLERTVGRRAAVDGELLGVR